MLKSASLDVAKLSGNIATFMRTNWNALNSSVNIDGTGFRTTSGARGVLLNAGTLQFINSGDTVGSFDNTHWLGSTRRIASLAARYGRDIGLSAYSNGDSAEPVGRLWVEGDTGNLAILSGTQIRIGRTGSLGLKISTMVMTGVGTGIGIKYTNPNDQNDNQRGGIWIGNGSLYVQNAGGSWKKLSD